MALCKLDLYGSLYPKAKPCTVVKIRKSLKNGAKDMADPVERAYHVYVYFNIFIA